ncbi:MAG: hypothetical protein QOH41_2463 [Blastocatellia bacterium]|jgi:hypothetical protein|nr:hypothetical protein [Blastocatellia bacterium]
MTSNDAQMDVLLRRYAGKSHGNSPTEHLDADELNAFAEGSLPEAARARYVSHLVDCDNCRQIISQLAINGSTVLAAEASTAPERSGYSWWKRLGGLFSPMTLRYAAFAIVLITAGIVVLFVTRQRPAPALIAQNEQANPESAVKPYAAAPAQTGNSAQSNGNENRQGATINPTPASPPAPGSDQTLRLDQSRAGDSSSSPPTVAKAGESRSEPFPPASKKAEPGVYQGAPTYAPPPPLETERATVSPREQQNTTGVASASGPRKSEPSTDRFKMPDRGRAGESGKDNRTGDDLPRLAANQAPASRRATDEKAKGPRRDLENNAALNRNANEARDAVNSQGVVTMNRVTSEEKAPETRSAGGRKFRRQGNAWVDAKFKSSMSMKSVARGSSDFSSLDSGLRSIAQQLGGEVIVVWKGKAYLIK